MLDIWFGFLQEEMTIKQRYNGIVEWFSKNMPSPTTELQYDTPFHLLLAVILSAQCTDKRVNMITPALFAAYPMPEDLAKSSVEEVFEYIKSVTFPNNKARHLVNAAKMIVDDYEGELPSEIDKLMRLPGVGRKTANVMLSVVWNKAAMAVDTHVFRVSNRIGLTDDSKTPLETEKILMKYLPKDVVAQAHHWLILHGRYVCKARKPNCLECGIRGYCKTYSKK